MSRTGREVPTPGTLRRILVLCRPLLGDMVLTGPVFRNLQAWQPEARIDALCLTGKRDPLSLTPHLGAVIEIPRRRTGGIGEFLGEWVGAMRSVRRGHYELVFDLMQTERSSFLTALSGARWRVGFLKGRWRQRHRAYTHLAPWREGDDAPHHALDLHLLPLEAIGMPVVTRSLEVEITGAERERARRLLGPWEQPVVVCHPGASSENKCWPLAQLATACDLLQGELGCRVALLGGAREAEALQAIRSGMRTEPALVHVTGSVRELAALLAEADLFFGQDSGPMHVAAAVGTPVVALFGASPPAQWRPLGVPAQLLRPSMPCPCPFPQLCRPPSPYDVYCVRRLEPEAVHAALATAVARTGDGASGARESEGEAW